MPAGVAVHAAHLLAQPADTKHKKSDEEEEAAEVVAATDDNDDEISDGEVEELLKEAQDLLDTNSTHAADPAPAVAEPSSA